MILVYFIIHGYYQQRKIELIVEEDLLKITPPRLDRWLAKKIDSDNELPTLSRTRLKQLILDGFVMQNGQTIRDPSAIVKHLQKYSVVIPEQCNQLQSQKR